MAFAFALVSTMILTFASEMQKGIPMIELETCQLEFISETINQGRWGGLIAFYDVSVAGDGAVKAITRRVDEKREHLARWVKLVQLETCVQRWRFERGGEYSVTLLGGTVIEDARHWIILVQGDGGRLRLRVPVHRNAG